MRVEVPLSGCDLDSLFIRMSETDIDTGLSRLWCDNTLANLGLRLAPRRGFRTRVQLRCICHSDSSSRVSPRLHLAARPATPRTHRPRRAQVGLHRCSLAGWPWSSGTPCYYQDLRLPCVVAAQSRPPQAR